MLNLVYPITDSVEIDGVEYKIDLAFDNVLRLLDMLSDDYLTDFEKVNLGLKMLLGTSLDYEIKEQADVFVELFKSIMGAGEEDNQNLDIEGNVMPSPEQGGEKIYSIKEDADYIFASFYQDYGIDLIEQQGKLHWYKFKAMLNGLKKDTQFKEILNIRTMELPSGKGSSKEREQIRKLKKQYALKGSD